MKNHSASWNSLFLVTFLAAYADIFNEWLFAVTRPSFLNELRFVQQIQVLLTVSALFAGLCLLLLLPLALLSLLPPLRRRANLLVLVGALLPAVIFAVLILVMVDNFTYTVFKFGIVSTDGFSRGLYGLGFLLVLLWCYRSVRRMLSAFNHRVQYWGLSSPRVFNLMAVVLLLSGVLLASPDFARASVPAPAAPPGAALRPHILLITADGLEANHMSVYGYSRDTTPFLREFARSALVAENAFANANHTTASVASFYTGKYPAKTRLFFVPQIFEGADAYEHLPGILHAQGYRNVQITVPLFLDANQWNMLDGFDDVKTSSAVYSKYLNDIRKALPRDKALFTDEIVNRAVDRVLHIFFIRKMTNPYLLVTKMSAMRVDDERWEKLRQEVRTSTQPLFVHVHLMVTHANIFNPQKQVFSAGQPVEGQDLWSVDFYDDSILDFDTNFGELVGDLSDLGLLDRSILIVGSDHGQQWDQLKRLPFIIRFPNGEHAGTIQANVQYLDLAPTILDYMGLDQPDWMPGTSLITGALPQRSIFGVMANDGEPELVDAPEISGDKANSPFYVFRSLSIIYCQKWFKLDFNPLGWKSGEVEGSTSACSPDAAITDAQAFQRLVEHLQQNGFDNTDLDRLPSQVH